MECFRKKESFERRSVRIMSWFLFTIGINVSISESSPREIAQLIIAIFPHFSVFVGTSMYAFTNRQEFDETVKIAAYFGNCAILIIVLTSLYSNKTKIKMLIQKLNQNVYNYPDEEDIEVQLEDILKDENSNKITIMVFYYACFGFALSILSPFIGFLITRVYVTSMYPSWFPWPQEGPLMKMFTCLFQGYVCSAVFWNCYALELFLIFLVIEFLKQYKRLCAALSTMHLRTCKMSLSPNLGEAYDDSTKGKIVVSNNNSKSKRFDGKETYDEIYRQNIIRCIKHHQEIHRLFKLFQPWFLTFFSSELFFSITTFALVFYNILTVSLVSDPAYFLTIVGSSVNVFALLFCRCFVGEMFSDMNNELLNAIFYEVNWLEQSESNKKLLRLFHMFAKQQHLLTAFSIFPASYYTFAWLMRSSYSYFNLLKTTVGKTQKID